MKTIYTLFFGLIPFLSFCQISADFTFQSINCAGTSIQFENSSTGNIDSYLWDFGDGNTSTETNPNHIYSAIGSYSVCLTALNNSGNENTTCIEVVLNDNNIYSILSFEGCEGDGYSVVIAGIVLSEGNPSDTLILPASNGCDSVIIINLVFNPTVSTIETYTFCEGENPGVTEGIEILTTSAGCDSTVQIVIEYDSTVYEEIYYEGCLGDGYEIEVNGTLYHESNPLGIEELTSYNGCDSIVTISLSYQDNSIEALLIEGCVDVPFSFEIGGVTFYYPPFPDLSNIPVLQNSHGCDSIISVFITLSDGEYEDLEYIGCTGDGYAVEVNGVLYDESNPTGTEVFQIPDECDSIVIIDLHFSDIQITSTVTPSNCQAGEDGSIQIIAEGGLPPYEYNWSNGSTGSYQADLAPGAYQLSVMDAAGCFYTENFVIITYEGPSVNFETSLDNCLGDGFINTTVTGGNPPFSYLWDIGATTANLDQLYAGSYTLTITDNEGCTFVEHVNLTQDVIDLEIQTTIADCDTDNGSATAIASTDSGEITYEWSTGATSPMINNLAPGWYALTVTDPVTNCLVRQNFEIETDPACFIKISGYVLLDDIQPDCNTDTTTVGADLVMVQLSDGQLTFTDLEGYYEFLVQDVNTYFIEVMTNDLPYEFNCPELIEVNTFEFGQHYEGNDFYVEYTNTKDISVSIVAGNARPGFEQWANVCLTNNGAIPSDGLLLLQHPDIQELEESMPTPDSYNANSKTLAWNFHDLEPGETQIYSITLSTPQSAELGTQLSFSASATQVEDDINPINNESTVNMEVTGSYDPNDKAVQPDGFDNQGAISMTDTTLRYSIRFQNTGTDTAFTVLIRDTLNTNLDINTIVPGPSSHPYTANLRAPNILELLFEDILLPDSTVNEPASHGFVFFDINIKEDSPYGTRIDNRAGIYFDFNAPIITNTVSNVIQMITGIPEPQKNIQISVTPNPFKDNYSLSFVLEKRELLKVVMLDINGKIVQNILLARQFPAGTFTKEVNTASLAPGMYILHLMTEQGESYTSKLIKY